MEAKLQQQVPQQNHVNKPNLTGIPTQMKLDFERRSGLSFDDVRVHYNSDKPAQLQALAYTQGTQVYVGPGQERHLKHELGHVVQQKQGRVKATGEINNILINSDSMLEHEADKYSLSYNYISPLGVREQPAIKAPIQCRLQILYDPSPYTTKPWSTEADNRPKFSKITEAFFEQFETAKEKTERKATKKKLPSINHIISYDAINKLLRGILESTLNKDVIKDGRPEKKKPKDIVYPSVFPKNGGNYLLTLIKMIIPKQTDYIVSHNIKAIDELKNKRKDYYDALIKAASNEKEKETLTRRQSDIQTECTRLVNTYEKTLERQRSDATALICKIDPAMRKAKINVLSLTALANDLEYLLNSSIGNLRLGDPSVNASIGSSIDLIDIEPLVPELISTPKSSAPKNALPIYSYTGTLDDVKGDIRKKAMNKRLEKLAILVHNLEIGDISGFQVEHRRVSQRNKTGSSLPHDQLFLKSSNSEKSKVPLPPKGSGIIRDYISGKFTIIHKKRAGVNQYTLQTDEYGHLRITIDSSSYSGSDMPLLNSFSPTPAIFPATPSSLPFAGVPPLTGSPIVTSSSMALYPTVTSPKRPFPGPSPTSKRNLLFWTSSP